MNIKKIWMMAAIFGVVTSGLFLFYLSTVYQEYEMPDGEGDEPIVEEEVELEPEMEPLLDIEEGKRAISIAVGEVEGVAGHILPGNFVDVISIVPTDERRTTADILLEQVKVLAVGHALAANPEVAQPQPTNYQNVTLELTPEEAAVLAFYDHEGSIVLMLRGDIDSTVAREIEFEESVKPGGDFYEDEMVGTR
ncbi:Flp pilus assembly protein CpaB [Desertibacillus haloalkaliphilus]|uniref:Flp pilus assembly protein CpaB n=1 Tax=Desertibacillus haloalkaliphilus TaxID=1328930 RepID=UPI001C26C7DC|nr:Flp pilus assembly protein CpaB [Desertibacillus haloalkaliphilus]MBU8908039.1 Flp pilus assembly protein CpaB [Desertibacillus haloalkaliphilus]